ncbi:MAG: glycosyltransferase [Chitinophagaceae bacterium]|nr:glycosyltransferase [Chitinophagaceae bacterium]
MPRVLRILNRLIVGGPSKNAVFLSRYMSPDFETLLVTGDKDDHEQDADELATHHGITPLCVTEMKRAISFNDDWKAYQKLKKIIREFKPDIVHTHAAKSGALGRLAARNCQVPVIVHTFHGHVFHSYFNPLKTNFFIRAERYLARFTDGIVAISEKQRHELVDEFKIAPANKFHIIPLGLDLDPFVVDQDLKRRKFRDEFQLAEDTIAIGIIGRLVPIKNHGLFIKALKKVLTRSNKPVKAFIIGDGESREPIMTMAREAGIPFAAPGEKNPEAPLVFTSWRMDVDVVCAGLDIICLTSLNEGTPVSLIEAQAAGRPIVSTRVGGIADVVLEGKTALLADLGNEDAFADQLVEMVDSEQKRQLMSDAGRDFVLNKYGYKRLVKDMEKLYGELLSKKSR